MMPSDNPNYPHRKLAMLVAGDFTALLTFATIGHFSHTDNLDASEIFMAALPFWIGELRMTEHKSRTKTACLEALLSCGP